MPRMSLELQALYPSQTWVIQHSTFSSWLFCFSLLQEEEVDSENEKLVVREPEDEDGECQASQSSAGRLWTALEP